MTIKLSVVSPLYRCRREVPEFLERLRLVLESCADTGEWAPGEWEVVLVDDHCPESSGSAAVAAWPTCLSGLRVIRLDRNAGQQAALWMGLRSVSGETVVVLDADLQDRPEDLVVLLGGLRPGVEVVSAGRSGHYTTAGRRFTAWVFRHMRTVLTRGRLPSDAGLFMAARGVVVGRMLALDDPGVHLLTGLSRVGASVDTIPVERRRRASGASAYSGWRRLALGLAALLDCTPAYPFTRWVRRRTWREPRPVTLTPQITPEPMR